MPPPRCGTATPHAPLFSSAEAASSRSRETVNRRTGPRPAAEPSSACPEGLTASLRGLRSSGCSRLPRESLACSIRRCARRREVVASRHCDPPCGVRHVCQTRGPDRPPTGGLAPIGDLPQTEVCDCPVGSAAVRGPDPTSRWRTRRRHAAYLTPTRWERTWARTEVRLRRPGQACRSSPDPWARLARRTQECVLTCHRSSVQSHDRVAADQTPSRVS